GHDDADAARALLQPRAPPGCGAFELLARRAERELHRATAAALRAAMRELEARKQLLRLRRHDVERIGDQQLWCSRCLHAFQTQNQIGEASRVSLAARARLVFPRPLAERLRVVAARTRRDAPCVREPPRFAALRGGLRDGKEIRTGEDLLPDRLLLRRGEK